MGQNEDRERKKEKKERKKKDLRAMTAERMKEGARASLSGN